MKLSIRPSKSKSSLYKLSLQPSIGLAIGVIFLATGCASSPERRGPPEGQDKR